MTKKDLRAVATAGGIGLAAFLAIWFFRKRVTIREISPAQVIWEGQ